MRFFNGASYLVSGGLFLVMLSTGSGGGVPWYAWLLGLAAIVYGLYVLFTKGSYWVSSATYLGPLVLIIWAFAAH